MAAQSTSTPVDSARGFQNFNHFTDEEMQDALFLVVGAARSLHSVIAMLEACGDADGIDPRELASLLDLVYRRIADATELEMMGAMQ